MVIQCICIYWWLPWRRRALRKWPWWGPHGWFHQINYPTNDWPSCIPKSTFSPV
jgi:hypothetical protein